MVLRLYSYIYNKNKMKIINRHQWTLNEIKFLNENYPANGANYCSDKLSIPINSIRQKSSKLGLKVNDTRKSYVQKTNSLTYDYPNINNFTNITTKEAAYILGILWADGYINKNNVILEIDKIDLESIKDVFFRLGEWRYGDRLRNNKIKKIGFISCCSIELSNILIAYGYKNKSIQQPKMIELIPDNIKNYFYRGLIDGDGCFYVNKKNRLYQFILAGSYLQEWKYFTNLLDMLNIIYSVKQKTQTQNGKLNQSSIIRICRKKDIIILGDYIYSGFNVDNIGMERKYHKFLEIKEE